jgi:predicted Zn-dependent protease
MTAVRSFAAAATLYGAALALAACQNDGGPGQCFESGATGYAFYVPGDTTAWFHWNAAEGAVRIYAEPSGALPANTDAAIALWAGAFRCGEIGLQRWTDSSTADIVLRTTTTAPPIVPKVRVLAADSVNACRGRTDIALDTLDRIERPIRSYVWPQGVDSAATTACYNFVTAHELGHALGLFLHSLDTADLMHSAPRRRALSVNDRYTIQVLYHIASVLVAEPR